jgi:hypothetical protein
VLPFLLLSEVVSERACQFQHQRTRALELLFLMTMEATNWEFKNRAIIFGLIIGVAFQFYVFDHQNVTAALADLLASRLRIDAETLARALFVVAALVLVAAAFLRTWASSYLRSDVVYAANIQSKSWLPTVLTDMCAILSTSLTF